MTSTELHLNRLRLPPLVGLLDDMLDQAIRARQRRVIVAEHPAMHLGTLAVSDDAIDHAIIAASLYGRDAALQLDARIKGSSGHTRDAAIFLRLALAVHTGDPALNTLASEFVDQHRNAVRDAYWFFPVPSTIFSDDSNHIVDLFNASADSISLRQLALELAALRGVKALLPHTEQLIEHVSLAPSAHFALACMGVATEATRAFVAENVLAPEAPHYLQAMHIAVTDPRLAPDSILDRASGVGVQDRPASVSYGAAWVILACRHPRKVHDDACQNADLPAAVRLQVIALTGFVDGLIKACAEMVASEGPISPVQADLLLLALGEIPPAARCEPNDAAEKSAALRALFLRACRAAHVGVHNDADRCAWEVEAILADPAKGRATRIRSGVLLKEAVPTFGEAMLELSHPMRQWLYIERAVLAKHPLPLSRFDVARRQKLALMIAKFSHDVAAD